MADVIRQYEHSVWGALSTEEIQNVERKMHKIVKTAAAVFDGGVIKDLCTDALLCPAYEILDSIDKYNRDVLIESQMQQQYLPQSDYEAQPEQSPVTRNGPSSSTKMKNMLTKSKKRLTKQKRKMEQKK